MSKITYLVAVGIFGPLKQREYAVKEATVAVSYPNVINWAGVAPIKLPRGLSTLFKVTWPDDKGRDATRLRSKTFERHLVVYKALSYINELVLAVKLVRVGHAEGCGLRTLGINDTLFYTSQIDETYTGDVNIGLRTFGGVGWTEYLKQVPFDPHNTTELAIAHIGTGSLPVARRYVRCFELLEHGFYSEAFIVAFSILDDLVQQMLDDLLTNKGMLQKEDRMALLRGIKENRLKLYLGPVLNLLTGHQLSTLWPAGTEALHWLNTTRNRIAHGGYTADQSAAAKGIFVCMKILYKLNEMGYLEANFNGGLFREAKLKASWTEDAPSWVLSAEDTD